MNEIAKLEKIRTKIKGNELSSVQGAKEGRIQWSPRSSKPESQTMGEQARKQAGRADFEADCGSRLGSRLGA